MTPSPLPRPAPRSSPTAVSTKVFVRGLRVEARIGVYDHELGRGQPLVIDAELDVGLIEPERLSQTYNYELIVAAARAIAESGHIGLVETFAWRLAKALLQDDRVSQVRVRVEKPLALAPGAQAAGVEILLAREGR